MARPPRSRPIEDVDSEGPRIHDGILPASGDQPALEFLEARPLGNGAAGPPILLIHGAFGGAWMWNETFLPRLARKGFHVAALSLRGHGTSDGYDGLRHWRLSDYLADVRRAFEAMPEAPVVIAHSLGGLLAQMLLGRLEMRGLVLLGSLPPDGLFLVGPRLAATEPRIWFEAMAGSLSKSRPPVAAAGYELLFSEGLPRDRLARYASRMAPESPQALFEAHMPGPIAPAALCRVPTLVVGGDQDRLIRWVSTVRTALYHGGEHRTARGMGHFMQLDIGADHLVERLVGWMRPWSRAGSGPTAG